MKITSMRIKGQKLSQSTMNAIVNELKAAIKHSGFMTDVEISSSSSIKIGLQGKSFIIDTSILGFNARLDYNFRRTVKGFTRTSIPTWKQRETMNHIVNDVLDAFDVVANCKSGAYTVRTKKGRVNSWYHIVYGNYYVEIVELNSELESEGKARQAEHRKEQREKRKLQQLLKVVVGGLIQTMTRTEYNKLRLQMSTGDFHTHTVEPFEADREDSHD